MLINILGLIIMLVAVVVVIRSIIDAEFKILFLTGCILALLTGIFLTLRMSKFAGIFATHQMFLILCLGIKFLRESDDTSN